MLYKYNGNKENIPKDVPGKFTVLNEETKEGIFIYNKISQVVNLKELIAETQETEQPKHAKLSASGSSRWLACPGSIIPDDPNAKPKPTGLPAKEGTLIHQVSEECLILGGDTLEYVGKKFTIEGEEIEFTLEFATYADSYIEYIQSHHKSGNKLLLEIRLDLTKYIPEGFGTADCIIIDHKAKLCHIIDLKTGRVEVEAKDNTQLLIYALGVKEKYNLEDYTYRLHIVQPKIHNYDSHVVTNEELSSFGDEVKSKANAIEAGDSTRNPGKDDCCKYCPNNPTCPALYDYVNDVIGEKFSVIEDNTDDRLLSIYKNKDLITDYLNKVEETLLANALSGVELKGFKLVMGKTNRQYLENAEAELVKKLGDKAFNKKLIGITESEKLAGKKFVADIVFKPEGKPVLVQESDKRDAINLLKFDEIVVDEL